MVREKRMVQKLKGQAYERDGPIVEIKLRPSKGKNDKKMLKKLELLNRECKYINCQ